MAQRNERISDKKKLVPRTEARTYSNLNSEMFTLDKGILFLKLCSAILGGNENVLI